jgi:ABC-type dipeptide/oligopeptide/nickel transport system permease subunit
MFVEAARGTGCSIPRILLRHILPNILPTAVILFTIDVPDIILIEAGLSFLGLGAQPPTPTWGNMLNTGRGYLYYNTLYAIVPGVAIFLTVLSLNIVGDSLRDRLDPRDAGLIKEDNA